MDLKVHINGKIMGKNYPIPDMDSIFHSLHVASHFGKNELSDGYYQIELDGDVNVYNEQIAMNLRKLSNPRHGQHIS